MNPVQIILPHPFSHLAKLGSGVVNWTFLKGTYKCGGRGFYHRGRFKRNNWSTVSGPIQHFHHVVVGARSWGIVEFEIVELNSFGLSYQSERTLSTQRNVHQHIDSLRRNLTCSPYDCVWNNETNKSWTSLYKLFPTEARQLAQSVLAMAWISKSLYYKKWF